MRHEALIDQGPPEASEVYRLEATIAPLVLTGTIKGDLVRRKANPLGPDGGQAPQAPQLAVKEGRCAPGKAGKRCYAVGTLGPPVVIVNSFGTWRSAWDYGR